MKVSVEIKAALGFLLGLMILKPIYSDGAFVFGFFYQLYIPILCGYKTSLRPLFSRNEWVRILWISTLSFSIFWLGYDFLQSYWAQSQGYSVRFYPMMSWGLIWSFLIHLFLTAYPEEFFYRGFLQHRKVSIFWVSLLFALGHFVGEYDPVRLLPFFPGLIFSWLVYRSGTLGGAILYHALCNVFSEWLAGSYHWS